MGRGQRTKAEWMDEDRGRDIFIHINYSAIRWMKIRPRLQPDAQTDPRGVGPVKREREKGPPRDWQRGLDGPILWLSAVTRPIRNGPSNILMRVGRVEERKREREREARIGGPKFRVSSWLINRSPDLFTPQGIGPLWLTSRIDACQLTMANRSLRLVLALPSLVIVQTVCPFCLGSGNHAMNRSRQLKASAC